MAKPHPDPNSPQWRTAFVRHYADRAKVSLFEAKRVAAIVQSNMYMLPPADAVAIVLARPEIHEGVSKMAKEIAEGKPEKE